MVKPKKPKAPPEPPTGLSAMENVVMELPETPKPPPPPPAPQHKVSKLKIALMIIGGILLCSLLIAASVFLAARNQQLRKTAPQKPTVVTPTPSLSPTPGSAINQVPDGNLANWKMYTNQSYGYSVKYPDTWYIYGDISKKDRFEIINFPLNKALHGVFIPENGAEFFINIAENKEELPIEKFVKSFSKIENEKVSETKVFVNSVEGIKKFYSSGKEGDLNTIRAYIPRNREVFNFTLNFYQGDIKQAYYNELFDQILSTFQFLD